MAGTARPRAHRALPPGAAIDSLADDAFTGRVAVKLGAIGLTYRGEGKFIERAASTRRIVVEARGSEQRGGGTAAATITATLAPASAGGTRVTVVTDLDVTGKPAQFGPCTQGHDGSLDRDCEIAPLTWGGRGDPPQTQRSTRPSPDATCT